MKRLLFLSLVLGFAVSATAQNPAADRSRWTNEYLYFNGLYFWGNPETGLQENILVVYNFSDVTFEVRAVFPEVNLDTTFTVTPQGNWFGGATRIFVGYRVSFIDPSPVHGRLYAHSVDTDRPINFVLSNAWYLRRNGR